MGFTWVQELAGGELDRLIDDGRPFDAGDVDRAIAGRIIVLIDAGVVSQGDVAAALWAAEERRLSPD